MTPLAALRDAADHLKSAGVADPLRDARRLMAHCLGISAAGLVARERDAIDAGALGRFQAMIQARCARQPVSQIIGTRDFYGRSFRISRDVLDPRPETELLIEVALEERFANVLDMGTGSGAILISLLAERPKALGLGTDISEKAVQLAGENAAAHGVADRIVLSISDWWEGVGGTYDLIVSNPPYISAEEFKTLAPEVQHWEPRAALTDEADGLTAYRAIAAKALDHLSTNGRLVLEIGPDQGVAVAEILLRFGFPTPEIRKDLDGRDRVVFASKP